MVTQIIKKRVNLRDAAFSSVVWFILSFMTVIVILPAMHILAASFSSAESIIKGVYFWPIELSLEGYASAFRNGSIMVSYKNTLIYVLTGATLNSALTIMAAFPLSRRNLDGRNVIMFLFSFTMLFSGGLIPTYIVVSNLKLLDTMWALILVNSINVWLLIVTRTFFQTNIPTELYEAANIDGCNDFKVLLRIVIPLSKAIIAVCLLMYAVGYWNGYFEAIVYLRSDDKLPLQLVLRNLLLSTRLTAETMLTMDPDQYNKLQQLQYILKYSCIVIATLPMLCLYPFVQKYFVRGIMVGAIKG